MKKGIILFTLIFIAKLTMAQNQLYTKAVDAFEINYNAGEYEKIFQSYDEVMKKTFPLQNTIEMFEGLKADVGKIVSKQFIDFKNGTFANYKTVFDKAIYLLSVSVDGEGKINGLGIEAYKEKTNTNVINSLKNLPKAQADLIFDLTKDFPNKTQLSLALINNGTTIFYGIIKQNDTIKFIDNKSSVFEIGSVSKVFTATLLANAVLEKKVKLTDDINKVFSFPFNNNIKLNFQSLANHTSGLDRLPSNLNISSNPTNPYASYDGKMLNAYLKNELSLNTSAEKKYAYSNLGAGLLGYTLGLMQKSNYSKLLATKIFTKYKMTSSFTNTNQFKKGLVKGLDANGKETSNWAFDALAGGGGILSTVTDMAKFITAQFDPKNKELELTRQPTFTVNKSTKMGLAWHILEKEIGKSLFWHNGGTGGYSSSVVMDLEQKNAIILLSNVSAFGPNMGNIDKLSFELLKMVGAE